MFRPPACKSGVAYAELGISDIIPSAGLFRVGFNCPLKPSNLPDDSSFWTRNNWAVLLRALRNEVKRKDEHDRTVFFTWRQAGS